MKKVFQLRLMLISLVMFYIGTLSCLGASHVWLVVGIPSVKPRLDSTFTTTIGVSSWNGVPGAVDISIYHNPRHLELVKVDLVKDSPFFQETYFNSDSSSLGSTRLVFIQSNNTQQKDTLYKIGIITWKVISIADSSTDIQINASSVVDVAYKPVEVYAFGQHIDYRQSNGISGGSNPVLPTSYELGYNYPNPFNPTTNIPYQIPENDQISIVIYDILGRQIKSLVNEFKLRGKYIAIWDGKDASGNSMSSGVYFYRMSAGKYETSKKMLLLK